MKLRNLHAWQISKRTKENIISIICFLIVVYGFLFLPWAD